jgi:K+-transporting ATPase ATPase C chain
MLREIRPAIVMMVLFTLVFGLAYPLAITGVSRVVFPDQSGGSLLKSGGTVVGSSLIAQGFAKPEYLHPRPSAAGKGWDPMNSGGSNMGPMDQKLIDRVATDTAALRKENPGGAIPADAVTTSASGLDPDISPENARMQAPRIAAARAMSIPTIQAVIDQNTAAPFLGFIGQPHVNVLAVNRSLDAKDPAAHPKR